MLRVGKLDRLMYNPQASHFDLGSNWIVILLMIQDFVLAVGKCQLLPNIY